MQPRDKTTYRVKKKPFNISTISLHKKHMILKVTVSDRDFIKLYS